jgi:hypothetical protein
VLTIGRHGASFSPTPAAAEEFRTMHSLRLATLFEPEVLSRIRTALARAPFVERVHEGIGSERSVPPGPLPGLLELLLNDAVVLRAVETVTDCRPLRCFDGRVSRLDPAAGDADSWHDDVTEDRRVALSVNLGTERFEGGALLIRDRRSGRIVAERRYAGFGDAFLFRIAPYLEHVVTKIVGDVPRTAYVGWFREHPDYEALLRGRLAAAAPAAA